MVQMRNEFLDSAGFINKNQAEYSILTDLYNACSNKCFLFQLKNLDGIKNFYTDVVKYINMAGSSFSDVDLFNLALDISSDGSYVLVRGKSTLTLMHNGKFDDKFNNLFADKQKMLEVERERKILIS